MKISIIIPVYNELKNLLQLIPNILSASFNPANIEIIVVNGNSEDDLKNGLSNFNLKIIESEKRQRAAQMNCGALVATGEVFVFIHADSQLPSNFDKVILDYCRFSDSGCFRMRFNKNNAFLSFYSFFTRYSPEIFHGGDASLYIKKEVFNELKGFDERYDIMEDYEFNNRIRAKYVFKIIPMYIITSARKYENNGVIMLQWHYCIMQLMFRMKANQNRLIKYYSKHIK